MRQKITLIIFMILPVLILHSQNRRLEFSEFDINKRNEIILTITNPSVSGMTYKTLVKGKAESLQSEAITIFPEKSFYFPLRNELMIYNQFGLFTYNGELQTWMEHDFIPSFSTGTPISPLSLKPLEMSPDGRYAVFIREVEDSASLILYDREMNVSLNITNQLKKEYIHEMVKWSPDSKYFIYRRGRELFYFSIDQYLSGRIPAESFRNLGFQDIQSIQWKSGNYLYILSDKLLYRVHSSEFFTRSFYSDPFRKGVVWSRIPVSFDPVFDRYSLDRDGKRLFLIKNGLEGMVIPLVDHQETSGFLQQEPMLFTKGYTRIVNQKWLSNGTLLLFLRNNKENRGRILFCKAGDTGFSELESGEITGLSANERGNQFAIFKDESVDLYSGLTMAKLQTFPLKNSLSFFWGRDFYYSTGMNSITSISKSSGEPQIIGLSQLERTGFDLSGDLYGLSDEQWYKYNESKNWIPQDSAVELRPSRQSTAKYRIYLEDIRGGWYSSSLKIRNMEGYSTLDFLPVYQKQDLQNLPVQQEKPTRGNPWFFDHGLSVESNEITLVLNAVDSSEGVLEILNILEKYGVEATIFINGDFIHANPVETRLIADSGHTVGSLFYTWFDMSDSSYNIDQEFLKKGMARNEDDYFIATGKELSLLWHTPHYFINSEILDASESLQYIYIGTDLPINDKDGRWDREHTYVSEAVNQAEALLSQVHPGAIIPFTLGKNPGQEESLVMLLPMVIEELIRQGYEFVDLSEMIKSSR
ncbi:polysaccharide deacetylase family protein [Oceanispirochaeta crateris]|nr:polysaccharide deacetylase family protein [Oceanispirochaeta crateris]